MVDKEKRPLHIRTALRLLHVYFSFARGMTMGVRAACFDAEGRIFLVRHSYIGGWHMPGGGLERNETVEEALAKELREEGNLRIIGKPQLVQVYFPRILAATMSCSTGRLSSRRRRARLTGRSPTAASSGSTACLRVRPRRRIAALPSFEASRSPTTAGEGSTFFKPRQASHVHAGCRDRAPGRRERCRSD